MGAFGLFALAILDGSPIPTLGGLDLLTAILAARHREPWYFYAIIATSGGLVGSFITYSIARKAGEAYLTRKLGESRVHRLLDFVRQWGGGTLIIATLFPPPFPATIVFAAAGILNYPPRRYLIVVAAGAPSATACWPGPRNTTDATSSCSSAIPSATWVGRF